MADKLTVTEDRYLFRIHWWLSEEQEEGACLGETLFSPKDLENETDLGSRDHIAATLALQGEKCERDSRGYYWDTRGQATRALGIANATIKADKMHRKGACIGWPEWAVTAKANGWTAPKTWKP